MRTGKASKCDRSGVNKSDCKGIQETGKKDHNPEIKAFLYMKGRRATGESMRLLDDQGAKDVFPGKKGDREAQ